MKLKLLSETNERFTSIDEESGRPQCIPGRAKFTEAAAVNYESAAGRYTGIFPCHYKACPDLSR